MLNLLSSDAHEDLGDRVSIFSINERAVEGDVIRRLTDTGGTPEKEQQNRMDDTRVVHVIVSLNFLPRV